ncbi:MAG: hypothetical protein ACKN9U_22625 [Pirellulaceae bacterium]
MSEKDESNELPQEPLPLKEAEPIELDSVPITEENLPQEAESETLQVGEPTVAQVEPPVTAQPAPSGNSFNDFGLDPRIVRAVEAAGYTQPTPIQAKTIPHLIKGRDVLGQAQTGT